jgi:hypothetical protein
MRTLISFSIFTILIVPMVVSAQYTPLVQMLDSGGNPIQNMSWQQYIDLLYATAIALAALLAVIKIVIAGAKYMFSDVITNKSEAKKDIQGALLGLLLILGAVLVLELINPRLANTTVDMPKLTPTRGTPPPAVSPATGGGAPVTVQPLGAVPPSATPAERNIQLYDLRDVSVGQATNRCTDAYGIIGPPNTTTNMIGCALPKAPPVHYRRQPNVAFDEGLRAFQSACTSSGRVLTDQVGLGGVINLNSNTVCVTY